MRAAVAGGGPVGIFTAMALARRGHEVTLVDRDPGPPAQGSWERAGVMQFRHAHGWRPQVVAALRAELPDVYEALQEAGARRMSPPGLPQLEAMACRREVVERVLRTCAAAEPGLTWRTGHIDDVLVTGHRAAEPQGVALGLVVDGVPLRSDVVVVATGRASRLGERLRGPVEGGSCGFSYVSRMYRARAGRTGYDSFFPSGRTGPGYLTLVMGHDDETHSVVIVYPSTAAEFAALRTDEGQERATRAIPGLLEWTDPDRFEPITPAMVGGHLTNTYRLQGPALGLPPAQGLFFLGDQVMTTNPAAGRNLALLLGHVRHFLAALDDPDQDLDDASAALDAWAEDHLRPWFLDHVRWDRTLLRRFAGHELDLSERIPSDVICDAVSQDPSLEPYVARYGGMLAGPEVLDPVEPRVRELLAGGWRPRTVGPSGQELAAAIAGPVAHLS